MRPLSALVFFGCTAVAKPMPLRILDPVVLGALAPADVTATLAAAAEPLADCLSKSAPELRVVIGHQGEVLRASAVGSTNAEGECLVDRLTLLKFPAPERGVVVVRVLVERR